MGRLLFSFHGRSNRAPYWGLSIAQLVGMAICAAMILASGQAIGFVAPAAAILFAVLMVSSLAVSVRRLHDRNRSGWWLLLYAGLSSVVSVLATTATSAATATGGDGLQPLPLTLNLVSFAISIAAFVDMGCLAGTAGPNRFGSDPLGRLEAGVFD